MSTVKVSTAKFSFPFNLTKKDFTVVAINDHVLVVPFQIIHFVRQFFFLIQYFQYQIVLVPIHIQTIIDYFID
jgi:hypothetical protein